ncbi:OmpW family protein [Aquabacterium sp. NJ1]|uniref:OmpW/AlkL family protein n=1 Tax=Aquabacterium sp. NJ1 TaxID=1538295 RepID=UPI0009DE252A|nr:OmpW family outer membrane protein [Aquabacterium sp. NJ1]
MKFSALSRTGFAVALSAVLASMVAPAQAETVDSIFAKVSPSVRDRMFFRLNYIRANVKTTSGNTYDVTGPVVATDEIKNRLGSGNPTFTSSNGISKNQFNTLNTSLFSQIPGVGAIPDDVASGYTCEASGIGTPCGIKARGQAMVGTPAVSVGYYLDDELSWVLEAYVLAAPLKVDIYGDGANHLNGQKIVSLKMLPPTAVLGRYFGAAKDQIRPFLGFGASYAMFFDARATDYLNAYQGGASAGDTTVTVENVLGWGPFLGLKANIDESWHASISVGKLRYKTDATLTTRNTTITSGSDVLKDYGPRLAYTIENSPVSTTALMCDLAKQKFGNSTCNLGTYVRKTSTTLDNTLFTFGVGRSF